MVAAIESSEPDETLFARNLEETFEHIEKDLGFPLDAKDRNVIEFTYRSFFEEQLGLRFKSHGRPPMPYHPTYRSLLLARDPAGRPAHFLSRPDDYDHVRRLALTGRLVPIVGDFAGPSALKAVAKFAREQDEVVTAFYVSNVEFYLLRGGLFPSYVENVRALPLAPTSVFDPGVFQLRLSPPGGPGGPPQHPRASEGRPVSRAVRPGRLRRLLGREHPRLRAMSERRRIRVDWEELEDAFADSSGDHRYYLDRETGAVHFFSSYLDNEDEEQDERAITAEERYVQIPHARRLLPAHEIREFVASLAAEDTQRELASSLSTPEDYHRFEEALAGNPKAHDEWRRFVKARMGPRIKSWLADVAVEPLD